jgi:prepilin-type N-terminal cleavage/methylation domain-containing protein/prepilin-type processing-associated H-X9-DG protein
MIKGFTLIEILVVTAVIAVLAGLLLPALAQGGVKARQTACVSNERQIAIALRLYVDENGAYPQMAYYLTDQTWLDPIRMRNTGCPDYLRIGDSIMGYSYGYNTAGTAGWPYVSPVQYGLGGSNVQGLDRIIPTKESDVLAPAELLAFGDSVLAGVYGDPKLRGSIDLGLGLRDRACGAAQRTMRHGGGVAVTFGDGHSERMKPARLFGQEDRQRWNTDHQTHETN